MIDYKNKDHCCGCSACEEVCPVQAIKMHRDALGFLYPELNEGICVKCNLCSNVCPFENDVEGGNIRDAYAARHNSVEEVKSSRSGAVFVALSDAILKSGGVIYGAGYGDFFRVKHKRASSKDGCAEFKGSKYSQSDICGVFVLIEKDLKDGLSVLFSGTPCQCAAVRRVIKDRYKSRLYLVDFVCHGVTSPAFWEDFLKWVEKGTRHKIRSVDFRDKNYFGWDGLHKESFLLDNGRKYFAPYIYYNDMHMRPSCAECPFSSLNRASDVTMGDMWGCSTVCPEMNQDNNGCSLVIVNTEKGSSLFQQASSYLTIQTLDIRQCIQSNLVKPTERSRNADMFYLDYKERGFDYILSKYYPSRMRLFCMRVIRFVKRTLKIG